MKEEEMEGDTSDGCCREGSLGCGKEGGDEGGGG